MRPCREGRYSRPKWPSETVGDKVVEQRQRSCYTNLPADERLLAPQLLARLAALIDKLADDPDLAGAR